MDIDRFDRHRRSGHRGGRHEMAPFGAFDSFFGGSMLSPFGMRDPFAHMDSMFGGFSHGDSGDDFFGGGSSLFGGGMMSMFGGGAPSGTFSSQTMVMSTTIGPDGKPQTKKFASSTIGDAGRNVIESQQAYLDSSSGVQRMALERHHGRDGHKVVREVNHQTGDSQQRDYFKGSVVDEQTAQQFNQTFTQQHARGLPQHTRTPAQLMASSSSSSPSFDRGVHSTSHALPDFSTGSTLGHSAGNSRRSPALSAPSRGGGVVVEEIHDEEEGDQQVGEQQQQTQQNGYAAYNDASRRHTPPQHAPTRFNSNNTHTHYPQQQQYQQQQYQQQQQPSRAYEATHRAVRSPAQLRSTVNDSRPAPSGGLGSTEQMLRGHLN